MCKDIESTIFRKLFLISLLLLALPLAACDTLADTASTAPTGAPEVTASVDTPVDYANNIAQPAVESPALRVTQYTSSAENSANSAMVPALSIDEIADLLYMREEEKLARDLYLALYEQWGTPVFQNIAASEQVHMDALLGLINQYGLQDPAADTGAAVFTDPSLQTLYDQLITTGNQSLLDALLVGATVEEIDILDLQGSLAQTSNGDIVPVYQSLLAGSENHLRAFVSSWERRSGEAYQPQYLAQDEHVDIIGGSSGGNGLGQGGNGVRDQYGSGGSQGQGGQGQGIQDGSGNRSQGAGGRSRGDGGGRGQQAAAD